LIEQWLRPRSYLDVGFVSQGTVCVVRLNNIQIDYNRSAATPTDELPSRTTDGDGA
jgi:hypothetical protein